MKYKYNPFTDNLDLVFDINNDVSLQLKFDSSFRDFDCWILSDTTINASGKIELAPL
jgi:hypothetical protein